MALQLFIQEFKNNPFAEAGTTTTTIKITGHGLVTGDMIVNETQRFLNGSDPCSRIATVVDADTITITQAITNQTTGDRIRLYKYVDRTAYLKTETLDISDRMDRRNSCTFKLILPDNTYIPRAGQNVKIVYDNNILFGGAIKTNKLRRLGVTGNYKLEAYVSSEGYGHIPSRRTIPANYLNSWSKDIIQDVVDNYLSQEGITYDAGELENGAYWEEYPEDFANNCISIKQILDDMASASGYKWYIDNSKVLHFFAEDTITDAPHVIKDTDSFKDYRNIEIEESLINYRNKQFVRGGADDFGDPIVIWQQSLGQIAMRQDVEGGSGVYGTIFEDENVDNTTQWTTESGTTETNITRAGHGLSDGDMIVNITRGNAKRIVLTVDANNFTVTSDGLNASAISGQTTGDYIVYYPDANNAARNNLKRYGKVTPKELTFETGDLGFRAGQKLTVNLVEFGMDPETDEHFLIEEVNFFATSGYQNDDYVIRANIKATSRDSSDFSTQHTENWIDTFAQFIGGGSSGSKINIAVGPNPPNNPKLKDIWVNTNARRTAISTGTVLTELDCDKIIELTGTIEVELPAPTSALDDKMIIFKSLDANTKTLTGTVDGTVNPTVTGQYTVYRIYCNGSAWYTC